MYLAHFEDESNVFESRHDIPQPQASLWRYLDLTKVIDLLSTQKLYFPAANRLGDPFEGSITVLDHERITRIRKDNPPLSELPKIRQMLVEGTYVFCWHANEGESAAMWKIYLKSDEGVAIRTTFGRLERYLIESQYTVIEGYVKYLDYEREHIGRGTLTPFFRKRASCAHEQECRAVISPYLQAGRYQEPPWQRGLTLPINSQDLIEDVYVAPGTADWVRDVVQSVLTKFGLDRVVKRSSLSGSPFFY